MKKKKKKILSHETEKFTSKNLKLLKGRFPSVWEQVQAPKRGNRSLQKKHPPCVEDKRIEDHIQKTKFLLYGDSDPVVSVKKIIDKLEFRSVRFGIYHRHRIGPLTCRSNQKRCRQPPHCNYRTFMEDASLCPCMLRSGTTFKK
jgi:hypothetical protein